MGMFLATLTYKEVEMALRLVRTDKVGSEAPATFKDSLRAAIDKITLGSEGQEGHFIFTEHEAKALYLVLASRYFTQVQLDAWIDRLLVDHPYDRKLVGSQAGLWVWVKWVFLGGGKPHSAYVESVLDWRKRVERYVDEQITCVDEPAWLERPLQTLNVVRHQIEREIGKTQWAVPVMNWALVQLLTLPPDVATSDNRATGSDAQRG